MDNERKIGILGSGGQADEAESYLSSTAAFRALSPEYMNQEGVNQINILEPDEYQKLMPVIAAIGAPFVRRKMVEDWPGQNFATLIALEAYVDDTTKLSEGVIIAPRAVVTTNVEVGSHSIINVGATVSHDCKLGEYVTISPGAHVAGNVELGDGVFIGIGAIVSNNVRIAAGSVVGAGAVILHDVLEENSVVVGIPARTIKINSGWLSEI